jgi:small subunit ribosomal protein S20
MANTKSAKKEIRKGARTAKRNKLVKDDMKTLIKHCKKAIESGDKKVKENLKKTLKTIDKAVQKNVIKKNNGSKKKSRLQTLFNAAQKK